MKTVKYTIVSFSVVDEKEENDEKSEETEKGDVTSSLNSTPFDVNPLNSTPFDVSPLWQMSVRDSVTSSKVPDHQINQMRSQLLAFDRVNLHLELSMHRFGDLKYVWRH